MLQIVKIKAADVDPHPSEESEINTLIITDDNKDVHVEFKLPNRKTLIKQIFVGIGLFLLAVAIIYIILHYGIQLTELKSLLIAILITCLIAVILALILAFCKVR